MHLRLVWIGDYEQDGGHSGHRTEDGDRYFLLIRRSGQTASHAVQCQVTTIVRACSTVSFLILVFAHTGQQSPLRRSVVRRSGQIASHAAQCHETAPTPHFTVTTLFGRSPPQSRQRTALREGFIFGSRFDFDTLVSSKARA
jgi:hypothetical protein